MYIYVCVYVCVLAKPSSYYHQINKKMSVERVNVFGELLAKSISFLYVLLFTL